MLPVSAPPIINGVVVTGDDGTILHVGERDAFDLSSIEIAEGIICPGFINAHCHVELSYMQDKIAAGRGIAQFIIDLIDYRNSFPVEHANDFEALISSAGELAMTEMLANGIVGVGDISNDSYTFISKANSPLRFHTFIECFGFYPEKAEKYFEYSLSLFHKAMALHLAASVTPHAPYSVPPELFQKIFSFRHNHPPLFSYHNQESDAEASFFKNGTGGFEQVLQHFNIPSTVFFPTGKNSLQSVIDYFPQDHKVLFVHNTTADANDVATIAGQLPGAYFCFCPNANLYIEKRLPHFPLFAGYPDRICIGTDSYASNHQLSILEEIKTMQKYDPSLSTAELIRWSTLNGARFFGWDQQLGSIEPGKKPGLNLLSHVTAGYNLTENTAINKLI